jgi:hypothetical protein
LLSVTGAEGSIGKTLVWGTAVFTAGDRPGAVIGPRGGDVFPAEEKMINHPISSPTAAPARPSRKWRSALNSFDS